MFLDPEYGGVNMSVAQLEAWIDNPNHRLASTATGLNSLSRLPDFVQKPESRWTPADYAFAKKVLNFNRRHAQQVINAFREDRTGGFGREVGKSGWSKRHIALRNWGHDPSDPDSPLYAADQEWLDEHPGAAERRNGRRENPMNKPVRMNFMQRDVASDYDDKRDRTNERNPAMDALIDNENAVAILVPFSRKTAETGRIVGVGDIDERVGDYTLYDLEGRKLGGAYIEEDEGVVDEQTKRQHMLPGAEVKGMGIGSALYMLGSFASAAYQTEKGEEFYNGVENVCTYSVKTDKDSGCPGALPTEEAQAWWSNALRRGDAFEAETGCQGLREHDLEISVDDSDGTQEMIEEDLESGDFDIESVLYDLAIRAEKAKFPMDEQFFLDALQEVAYRINGTGKFVGDVLSYKYGAQWALEEFEVDYESPFEGGFTLKLVAEIPRAIDEFLVEEALKFDFDYEYINNISISDTDQLEYSIYAVIEIAGSLTNEADDDGEFDWIITVDDVDVELEYPEFVTVNVSTNGYAEDAVNMLCGVRIAGESNSVLYAGPTYEGDVEVAEPAVYAQIALRSVDPYALAFILASNEWKPGYIDEAMTALRESPFNESRESQDKVYAIENLLRYAPATRRPNPSKVQQLYEEALEFSKITDGGDGTG